MKYMHICTLEITISDIDEYVLAYGQLNNVLMGLVRLAAGAGPGAVPISEQSGSRSWDAVAQLDVNTPVTYLNKPMAAYCLATGQCCSAQSVWGVTSLAGCTISWELKPAGLNLPALHKM